jgi:hypothetical protein
MDLEKTAQLIGYSHKNKGVNIALKQSGFNTIPEPDRLHKGVPFAVTHKHINLNISLSFEGYKYFFGEYGEPNGYTEKHENELILKWIVLQYDPTEPVQIELKPMFPFDIHSSKHKILEALEKENQSIKKAKDSDAVFYIQNNKRYDILFDATGHIQLLIISLIRKEDRKTAEIESNLKSQKKNILSKHIDRVQNFVNPIPTLDWNYQSEIGSKNAKKVVSAIFYELQNNLAESTNKRDPEGIYFAVKEAIIKLNNAQDIGLQIDTDERELLCETIEGLLTATGFDSMNVDITTKWREW